VHPNSVIAFQGDYDPKRTKVLQYSMNPFSMAHRKLTTDLEQLQEENRRLTKRLQIMEESRSFAVGDLSARVDNELHTSAGKEVEGMMKWQECLVTYTVMSPRTDQCLTLLTGTSVSVEAITSSLLSLKSFGVSPVCCCCCNECVSSVYRERQIPQKGDEF